MGIAIQGVEDRVRVVNKTGNVYHHLATHLSRLKLHSELQAIFRSSQRYFRYGLALNPERSRPSVGRTTGSSPHMSFHPRLGQLSRHHLLLLST